MKSCVFCGQPGDTKEHIIPRWLQKHFDLKDQRLGMINKTTIQYCRVVLPACSKCNSEIFSRLESKVRQSCANEQDYYLWALKIRYCLSMVDSTLLEDQANPSRGAMLSKEFASIGHEFIQHTFTHLSTSKFHFRPYPFGSVFLFDKISNDNRFGFVDVSHPYWALTIAIPGGKVLSVLFTDRGLVKRSLLKRYKANHGFDGFRNELVERVPTEFYAQYLTFRLLIAQYQLSNIPYGVSLKPDGVYSKKLPTKLKYRAQLRRQVLFQIADFCGLPHEFAGKASDSLPTDYRG